MTEDTAAAADAPASLDVLADETRLAILQALADHRTESPREPALGFADLRRAVGMRDSGNFDYHLDKLRGRYVEQDPEGYRLTVAGMRVVSSLAAGRLDPADRTVSFDLAHDCPDCGTALQGAYRDGALVLECENDHGVTDFVPATVVAERSPDELVDHFARRVRHHTESVLAGFCGLCSGPVDRTDHRSSEPTVFFVCQRCGVPYAVPPSLVALVHPAVRAFAHERGVDFADRPLAVLDVAMGAETEQVATDPPRWEVTVSVAGDETTVTVDDEPAVVDVARA